MPERDSDPIASTQMFRAFVQGGDQEQAPARRRLGPILVSVVLAVAVAAAVVVWLIVR
jgi:hypothetical protein